MRPWTKIRCVYSLLLLMLLVACGDKTVAITDVQPLLFQTGDLPQNLAIRPIQRSDAQAFYNAQILG
jgi:hypothetical protein